LEVPAKVESPYPTRAYRHTKEPSHAGQKQSCEACKRFWSANHRPYQNLVFWQQLRCIFGIYL